MNDARIRRLSLVLVIIGMAIGVLGFSFVGTTEGLLGIGILVAGLSIYMLISDKDEPRSLAHIRVNWKKL